MRFVPKSQYDRIHAGWRACVVPAIRSRSSNANHVEEPEAADASEPPNNSGVPNLLTAPTALASAAAVDGASDRSQPAASAVSQSFGGADLTMLWLCAAVVVLWLGSLIVDSISLAGRRHP